MRYDYLLIGGGLQSGLIALALRHHRPHATIAIVERGNALGGNHTWSHHAGDIPDAARPWFEPLVQWRWTGYDVVFPAYRRTLAGGYASFAGAQLDGVVRAAMASGAGSAILLGADAVRVEPTAVELHGGARLEAGVVIDARGPSRSQLAGRTGYQKFLGLDVLLRRPHHLARPVLMDATVAQHDGFRFVYALPLTADRVLIEDTYFSDDARIDPAVLRDRLRAWADSHGLEIAEVLREEQGILAMPCVATPVATAPPLRAGYAGGWINPATGYSLPIAVRLAQVIADPAAPPAALTELARAADRQIRFLAFVNRLLFEATSPRARRYVLERFYRLPPACIARFYAMQLTPIDQLRILVGRPPREASLARVLGVARDGLWRAIAPTWNHRMTKSRRS